MHFWCQVQFAYLILCSKVIYESVGSYPNLLDCFIRLMNAMFNLAPCRVSAF